MRRIALILLAAVLMPAMAGVDLPPALGSIAPALALYSVDPPEDPALIRPVQLDEQCGIQVTGTAAVLVMFVNRGSGDSLAQANEWMRLNEQRGLQVIAIAEESDPKVMREIVRKGGYRFPVLDDRYGVVAHRYGVDAPPASYLLNSECRVLRSWRQGLDQIEATVANDIGQVLDGKLGRRAE